MKVKNINGTSSNKCECDSWLEHWEEFSGETADRCAEKSCTEQATVGAHVQKANSSDRSWYIIPLCKKHNNQKGGEIELRSNTTLVSANVDETCGV